MSPWLPQPSHAWETISKSVILNNLPRRPQPSQEKKFWAAFCAVSFLSTVTRGHLRNHGIVSNAFSILCGGHPCLLHVLTDNESTSGSPNPFLPACSNGHSPRPPDKRGFPRQPKDSYNNSPGTQKPSAEELTLDGKHYWPAASFLVCAVLSRSVVSNSWPHEL